MAQDTGTAPRDDGTVDLDRDRALVLRCQAGDPAAFAELYTWYAARLHRFCLRRLHDSQEAEDVTQEAFLKAWRALPGFGGERRFYPWLTVIAGNLCTDALRRRSTMAPTVDFELDNSGVDMADGRSTTEERIDAAVDGELLHRALGGLNVRHRRVLELREGSEWSYKEIARFEGLEVSAVETLLWRARQALKREFESLSGTPSSLGAVLLVGAGAARRWRAMVARHGGIVQHGATPVRDALVALMVTSAVATSAAIPLTVTGAPAGRPTTVQAAATAREVVPATPVTTVAAGAPALRRTDAVSGGAPPAPALSGTSAATPAGATPATGGEPVVVGGGGGGGGGGEPDPGKPSPAAGPAPVPVGTVRVPTAPGAVTTAGSAVGNAATSAVTGVVAAVTHAGPVPTAVTAVLATVVGAAGDHPPSTPAGGTPGPVLGLP